MPNPRLMRVRVENFRELTAIDTPLAEVSVFVGPAATGKTTFVDVIRFLKQVALNDLSSALSAFGGFNSIAADPAQPVVIEITGCFTESADRLNPDTYLLSFEALDPPDDDSGVVVHEKWRHLNDSDGGKVTEGFTLSHQLVGYLSLYGMQAILPDTCCTGLHAFSRIGGNVGAEITELAQALSSIQIFRVNPMHPDLHTMTLGDGAGGERIPPLREDASNLADVLWCLRDMTLARPVTDDLHNSWPWIRGYDFTLDVDGATVLSVAETNANILRPLSQMSSGVAELLALSVALHHPERGPIIILDGLDGLDELPADVVVNAARSIAGSCQVIVFGRSDHLLAAPSGQPTLAPKAEGVKTLQFRSVSRDKHSDYQVRFPDR